MGRFRSFVWRVAKPAAMVAVVGTLSSALIITTPSNAQALVKPKVAETFIMGATKVVAPAAQVALAAASFTPVGLGVRLLQLGILAYSTSDIWMPIVTGAFGVGTSDEASTQGTGTGKGTLNANFQLNGITVSGTQLTLATYYPGTATVNLHVATRLKCKRPDGTTVITPAVRNYSNVATPLPNLVFSCITTINGVTTEGTPVGFEAGLAGDGTLPLLVAGDKQGGPKNHVMWGEFIEGGFDPRGADVKYKVENECIDAAGNYSTISAETMGDVGALKMPSCEAAGKGHGTGKTSIKGFAPGTTVEQPLWDSPRAPSDPATPLCDAARPTGGCELSIELDGKPCTSADIECQNWAEIQQNDPNNTRLKCRFGPYTLPMASCVMLEQAYWPGGSPSTEENTDGDPATRNWNDVNANPIAPQAPTTTATVPGGQGQPVPGPSGSPEQRMANCWPTGWAMFNPVEWVLKPTRCAFEPSQTPTQIQARANATMNLAQGKAPISFITNTAMIGPGGGGCPNWTISVAGLSKNVVCDSSFTAALLGVRLPLFGLVATAMVWPLLRSIWYAAIPILRVAPSSGGK